MARTIEAFAVYHRQKEDLNNYLQVSAAGLSLLRRNIDVPNSPALLGALVDACGVDHWGKGKQYSNAAHKVDAGIAALADHGIVQHVAAFDVFSRAVIQDVARFSSHARANFPVIKHPHNLLLLSPAGRWVSDHCCHDLAGRLDTLSKRLVELSNWINWSASRKLSPILPVFDLIRSIRNRIAHDGGIVGADLENLATSKPIVDGIAAFRTGYSQGDLPPLPVLRRGRSLGLTVVHAILFGAFLYEIAKELNAYAAGMLSDGEFIDMAFYYSCIVEEHPFRTVRHRTAEARVNYFLAERYLRERNSLGNDDVIRHLKSQAIGSGEKATTYWKVALARHEDLIK